MANFLHLDRTAWCQEIQPFGEDFVLQDCAGGSAVKFQLLSIKLGALGNLAGSYFVGLEIYYEQALRCLNQHINYALNDNHLVARR